MVGNNYDDSNRLPLILCSIAVLISSLVFFRWISADNFLRSDHNLYSATQMADRFPATWTTSNSPGGHVVLNLWDAPLRIFQYLIGIFNLDSRVYDRIVFFIPIVFLSPLLSFSLVYKITRSSVGALVGSLIFSYNTYFLSLIKVGHLGHVVAAILSVGAISLAIDMKSNYRTNRLVQIILLLALICIYSVHIAYITIGALILYAILESKNILIKTPLLVIKSSLLAIILFSSLMLFGWLPSLSTQTLTSNAILERPIIHQEHYTILKSLTIHHPFWNGTDTWFISYNTPAYLFILPILVGLSLIFTSHSNKIFFFLLGLGGIFLGKLTSAPLGVIYENLYNYLIGFSAFREPSKFYYLIAISYAVLIGLLVSHFQRKNAKFSNITIYTAVFLVIGLTLANIMPILTGTIKGLYVPVEKPPEYRQAQNVLGGNESYFRTITVPVESKWLESTSYQPKFDIHQAMESVWHKNINYNRIRGAPYIGILLQPFSKTLLDHYSVRYLIVPLNDVAIKSIDDFSIYFDLSRDYYISLLDSLPYLKRVKNPSLGSIVVYENIGYLPHIRSITEINYTHQLEYLNLPAHLSSLVKITPTDFTTQLLNTSSQSRTFKAFGNISGQEIQGDVITRKFNLNKANKLYYSPDSVSLTRSGDRIILTKVATSSNYQYKIPSDTSVSLQENFSISYLDPSISNLISNYSFEAEPWTDEVKDCDNYDSNPIIGMEIDSANSTEGLSSLKLSAQRHDACTYLDITVEPGKNYLLSFDIKTTSNASKKGYYFVGFNDDERSYYTQNINIDIERWKKIEERFTVPDGATAARVFLYARSGKDDLAKNSVWYDNVLLNQIPETLDGIWISDRVNGANTIPKNTQFDLVNPTKKLVHIKGATSPFYLAVSESFHPQWQAQLTNSKIGIVNSETGDSVLVTWFSRYIRSWVPWVKPDRIQDDYHFKLDGFLNGWYVEPEQLCGSGATGSKLISGCTRNADGSYDIELVLEFFPQRWFYFGLLISGTTLLGCMVFLIYDVVRRRQRRVVVE